MPIGSTWAMSTAGKNASSGVRPRSVRPDRLGGHQRGHAEHELVEQAGADHARGGARAMTQLLHPDVDGTDEAGPAALRAEASTEARVIGGDEHEHQAREASRQRWRRRGSWLDRGRVARD